MTERDDRFLRHDGFKRIDDMTGFEVRAKDTVKQWDGLIVRKDLAEERHPQEFIRGRPDRQAVPDARPDPPAAETGPARTTLSAAAAAAATSLVVASTSRFRVGDKIRVALSDGDMALVTIATVVDATHLTIDAPGLPRGAPDGAYVLNTTSVRAAVIG